MLQIFLKDETAFLTFIQADRDKKRQEQLEKKQLKKKLLEEEEEKVGGKARGTMAPPPKVTRAQAEEAKEKREQLELAAAASRVPAKVVETPREEEGELEENPNQLLKQSAMEGEAVARGVDSAIAVLGGGEPTELHPEKRMKAAYAAFEERELPKLKEENPNLRLSQLKQLLRKEWQKSPDNPMNQALAGRSTST